jgi:hypothetical protein
MLSTLLLLVVAVVVPDGVEAAVPVKFFREL